MKQAKIGPPTQILLADDDESDRLIFKLAFEEMKFPSHIEFVKDGVELMNYLNQPDVKLPQLLFLDLNMPRKNGLECLKEIKEKKEFADILIAIYSTSTSEKDIEETFYRGANIYIQKPSDFTVLKQTLEKALQTTIYYLNPPFNIANFLLKI